MPATLDQFEALDQVIATLASLRDAMAASLEAHGENGVDPADDLAPDKHHVGGRPLWLMARRAAAAAPASRRPKFGAASLLR
jgi:hypothetical protein